MFTAALIISHSPSLKFFLPTKVIVFFNNRVVFFFLPQANPQTSLIHLATKYRFKTTIYIVKFNATE